MDMTEKLTFQIDCYTPTTLPMARLAQYLLQLASLYGSEEYVHFEKIENGSARLQVSVEPAVAPCVLQRLQNVHTSNADVSAQKAWQVLDQLLRVDGAVGVISHTGGEKILDFPGRKTTLPETFTIIQPSSADGVVIKIGGKDDTIPVILRNTEGKIINCQIRGADNAKNLARYYLEGPIRVHGNGKWIRAATGAWELESLLIQSWEELDTAPLDEVLAEIGKVAGNGWRAMDEPLLEWRKIRGLK